METYNIKEKLSYLEEVVRLTRREWGTWQDEKEFEKRVFEKVNKITLQLDDISFCILVLLDGNSLVGFISLLPSDCDEHPELTPWYATMYVKKEYRGRGHSKKLNDAILEEAKKRGFNRVYLKSDLINYYEKFGAHCLSRLGNGENLYCIDM